MAMQICISNLASIAAFAVSVAVAAIAAMQYKVSRDKLRLDLYDRRYKVYDATRMFLSAALIKGTSNNRVFRVFNIILLTNKVAKLSFD